MKYIVLLCDGMADTPCEKLSGKTPMEAANKPTMDSLVPFSEMGTVCNVPDGLSPGSDVANLSVLGYNPLDCYTGRSPLEAANIGVELADDDVAFRCNLVTLSNEENFADKTMVDYCAGDIHTHQADEIIKTIQAQFGGEEFDFYTGTAYRHCMVWHGGKSVLGKLTPPHDITGQVIGPHLSAETAAQPLLKMMEESMAILADHPINKKRKADGQNPANAIWLWGHGKRPSLQKFREKYGVSGAMVSAVDLLKGIGRLAGMKVYELKGATGYIDTDLEEKCAAAVDALSTDCELVYIHIEAPDECGHRGEIENKVKAIEEIDRRVLAPLLEKMKTIDDVSLLILPDHPTPLNVRTHTSQPVPFLLYRSNALKGGKAMSFTEETAAATGIVVENGYEMMSRLLNN